MTDRELLEMALTKLEQLRVTIDSEWGSCRDLSEIDAADEQWPEVITLRARLAEPEPEPVAWLLDEGDGSGKYLTFGKPEHYKGTPLYTAPPARAALKAAK